MRPVLLMEAVRLFDGPVMLARLLAALEMIHTYSLIHDDLPAMDDDVLRRGKATNHVVFGEAMAILAGDGLLNCAMQIMAQNIPYENARYLEGYLRAMTEIIVAAGHEGMIGGQVLDVLSEGKGADKEALDYIHKHKTGALLTGRCEPERCCRGLMKSSWRPSALTPPPSATAFSLWTICWTSRARRRSWANRSAKMPPTAN